MSSGFVTESEIAEARRKRQEEWEKVRTEDQPEEAPEEEYTPIDNRPLFHRLEEQKQKKDAEYEEAHKLKNMIRGLDDDEVGFLDLVERTKASAARQISLEEKKEMKDFRERVSTLQEQAEKERLAQQLSKPAAKRVGSNVSSTRSLLQGVVVKKRKLSDTESNGVHDDNSNKNSNGIVSSKDDTSALNGNNTAEITQAEGSSLDKGALRCIAVLPGLSSYGNESSDSDQSSDAEDTHHLIPYYDLLGEKTKKPVANKEKK